MRRVFADTSFYQALLNPRDRWHKVAVEMATRFDGHVVTSEYVLCELGALMSRGSLRALFVDFVHTIQSVPYVEIVAASSERFKAGFDLFSTRADKEWSLTDCISFALMQSCELSEALTCDHHFEQAGFRRLLQEQ